MASSTTAYKVDKVVPHNSNINMMIHLLKGPQVLELQMIVCKAFKISNSIIIIRKNIKGGRAGTRGQPGGLR